MFNHHSDITFVHQPLIVAVIGWSGFNCQNRLVRELLRFIGRFIIFGFDLRPPPQLFDGVNFILVRDNNDLARELKELRPNIVLIETPCDCHPEHICIALEAGAKLIISEKCIGGSVNQTRKVLLPALRSISDQQVFIVDHYRLLELILLLHANAHRWLGEVKRLEVVLFEEQGVPSHQERSHFNGMTNFFHHIIALADLFLDLNKLIPVQASWAKHPFANVPDTYRSARFISKRTGEVVLEGAVGKYMKHPAKIVRIEGTKGVVVLDRDNNSLVIVNDGISMEVRCYDNDNGYRTLISALANGTLPPTLLTVEKALDILRLVEQAHEQANELPFYPDGHRVVFAEDEVNCNRVA